MTETWWQNMQAAIIEMAHDPQAQKIAGTLAVFSFILYLLVKET